MQQLVVRFADVLADVDQSSAVAVLVGRLLQQLAHRQTNQPVLTGSAHVTRPVSIGPKAGQKKSSLDYINQVRMAFLEYILW